MRRRAVLGACSGVGSIALTGCLDSPEEESTESAGVETDIDVERTTTGQALELVDIHLDADDLTYRDEFTVTVSLANIGDEPVSNGYSVETPPITITTADQGEFFDGHRQQGTKAIALDPGDVTTATLGPFHAAATGSWRIEASEDIDSARDDLTVTFDVSPLTVDVGEPFLIAPSVSATVDSVQLRAAYLSDRVAWGTDRSSPVIGMDTAAEGEVFAIPELSITNERLYPIGFDGSSQQGLEFTRSQFSVVPAERAATEHVAASPWLDGEPLRELTVATETTKTAWLQATIEADRRDDLTLTYSVRDDPDRPDVRLEIDEYAYPQFELVEFITPDQWNSGEQQFGARIENVGDAPGEFHGIVQYANGTEFHNPARGSELTVQVGPGETAQTLVSYDHDSETDYRLLPFEATERV